MERQTQELIRHIAELIALPSVSSANAALDMSNRPVCERLADLLTGAGCECRIEAVPDAPGKVNLIARFGAGPAGLALCGHTDTVPCDPALWRHDPFSGSVEDERLYGLGSSDMKGFLALIAGALASVDAKRLKRSVVVIGSADEESSMSGARALCDAGNTLAPFAVIGEPTSLRPVRQHKGIIMETIRLDGRSGHASNPALGNNAIEGMHAVISALCEWRAALRERYPGPDYDVPYPTLNFGAIHGGDNANRICAGCELHVDLRLTGRMTASNARSELRRVVTDAVAGSGLVISFRPIFDGVNALDTAPDSRIVRACEHLSGHTAGSVNFGTEAPFYTQLGAETVVFGPGDIDLAHQPNEYLDLAFIDPTVQALKQLVHQFCRD